MIKKYLEKAAPEGSYVVAAANKFWIITLATGIVWSVYHWVMLFLWLGKVPADMHGPGLVVEYSCHFEHLLLPLWILALASLSFIFQSKNYVKTMHNRGEEYVSRGKVIDLFGITFVLLTAILAFMIVLFVSNGALLAICRAAFQYTTYGENYWRVIF